MTTVDSLDLVKGYNYSLKDYLHKYRRCMRIFVTKFPRECVDTLSNDRLSEINLLLYNWRGVTTSINALLPNMMCIYAPILDDYLECNYKFNMLLHKHINYVLTTLIQLTNTGLDRGKLLDLIKLAEYSLDWAYIEVPTKKTPLSVKDRGIKYVKIDLYDFAVLGNTCMLCYCSKSIWGKLFHRKPKNYFKDLISKILENDKTMDYYISVNSMWDTVLDNVNSILLLKGYM